MKSKKLQLLAMSLASLSITDAMANTSHDPEGASEVSKSEPFQHLIAALRQAGVTQLNDDGTLQIPYKSLNAVYQAAKADGLTIEVAGAASASGVTVRILEDLNPGSPVVDPARVLLKKTEGAVPRALIQNGSEPTEIQPKFN